MGRWFSSAKNSFRKLSDVRPHESRPPSALKQDNYHNFNVAIKRPSQHYQSLVSLFHFRTLYTVLCDLESKKPFIIVKGAGGRAFSAGGDVKALSTSPYAHVKDVFKYQLQSFDLVSSYKKPFVAVMDGITMGGSYCEVLVIVTHSCDFLIHFRRFPVLNRCKVPDRDRTYNLRNARDSHRILQRRRRQLLPIALEIQRWTLHGHDRDAAVIV